MDRGWPTAVAIAVVGVLALNTCSGDTVTGAKVAAGGAAVGVGAGIGVGVGAAGAGAAGAVKRGTSKRVEDAISGRNRRPQSPRQPRTPTTQPTPSPSIPPTTATTRPRPQPTPTTRPKADMTPDWCIAVTNGVCVTIGSRR